MESRRSSVRDSNGTWMVDQYKKNASLFAPRQVRYILERHRWYTVKGRQDQPETIRIHHWKTSTFDLRHSTSKSFFTKSPTQDLKNEERKWLHFLGKFQTFSPISRGVSRFRAMEEIPHPRSLRYLTQWTYSTQTNNVGFLRFLSL